MTTELPQAETVEAVTIDIAGDVLDSVVSNLAEDDQKEQADEVISQIAQQDISLDLISKSAFDNPYFSSSANSCSIRSYFAQMKRNLMSPTRYTRKVS